VVVSTTFGTGRKAAIFANVIVMVALAAVAAVAAVYLTGFTKARARIDLTATQNYSLSAQTLSMLGSLERDVEITAVTDPVTYYWDVDQVRPRAMEYTRDLLREYAARSNGRVAFDDLDVRRDPSRVRDLLTELGINESNFVVVRAGDNRRVLTLETDLAEIDPGYPQVRPTRLIAYRVEEAVSGAIYAVVDDARPRVYAITGHDEIRLDQAGDAGGSLFAASLRKDNVEIVDWSLFAQRRIPDDAVAVFLLGPRTALIDDERAALDAYLRRGGRMLVLSDPLADDSLDALFEQLGLAVERNVIVYPRDSVAKEVDVLAHYVGEGAQGRYGTHPIVRSLATAKKQMLLVATGAVAARPGFERSFTTLLASHPSSFGDVPQSKGVPGDYTLDVRIGEVKGERILGAALEPTDGPYSGARVVYLPSSALATNGLARHPANDEFLRRATSWLLGRRKSIELPPRRPPLRVSDLEDEEYGLILRYTAGYMPLAAALLALLVWFARRR
jgi:hypothetical protein